MGRFRYIVKVTHTHSPERILQLSDTKTLAQVGAEMSRQIAKWGVQNHPSYTRYGFDDSTAPMHSANGQWFKFFCDRKAADGTLSWNDILMEEVFEALDEAKKGDLVKLREELIQVAAVACSWIESIDRNNK